MTAIYVFKSIDDYILIYKGLYGMSLRQLVVETFYLDTLSKSLWIIAPHNTPSSMPRPQLNRSFIISFSENIDKYITKSFIEIFHSEIYYSPKDKSICFKRKKFRKPIHSIPIQRMYGDPPKRRSYVNYNCFYDSTNDRLNFILS